MGADLRAFPMTEVQGPGSESHMAVQLTVTEFCCSVGNKVACVLTGNLDIWASVRKSCFSDSPCSLIILMLAAGKGAAHRQQLAQHVASIGRPLDFSDS